MAGLEWIGRDAREVVPLPFEPLATELAHTMDHLSIQDRLDEIEDPLVRDLQDGFWTSLASAPAREAGLVSTVLHTFSLSGWRPELIWETNGGFTIAGGTGALVGKLRADLRAAEVRKGSTVRAVTREDGVVRVATDDGAEHLGRACVMALPVNALRRVRFTPDLEPGRRRAVDEGVLGRGVKLWARLRGELPHFYALAPGSHRITIVESESHVDGDTLVLGFGPSAQDLDIHDPAAVQEAVRELVPGAEVVEAGGHDWTHDPFSETTWCTFRPDQMSRSLLDLQRPEGRTSFCGGDIANGWAGYIDGAIESGIGAGRGALAVLAGD